MPTLLYEGLPAFILAELTEFVPMILICMVETKEPPIQRPNDSVS